MKLCASMGVAAACALVVLTTNAFAQQKEIEKKAKEVLKDQVGKMGQEAEEMDPEMKAWMEAATPGPNHKLLEYSVGSWDALVRHWDEASGEAQESTGTSTSKWVLGGRYVMTKYNGEFMGMPFEGVGYCGYDNIKKTFVSTWMDMMSTSIMIEEGTFDPASKTFTYTSEFLNPAGEKLKSKSTIQIVDKDKHIMTFHHAMPGADEMKKVMEITYTRSDKSTQPG